jgi:hypothetical protein
MKHNNGLWNWITVHWKATRNWMCTLAIYCAFCVKITKTYARWKRRVWPHLTLSKITPRVSVTFGNGNLHKNVLKENFILVPTEKHGYNFYFGSWGSSVSVVSDYRLDDRCLIPGRGKVFFLFPLHPDQLWGPPSLRSNEYRVSFPGGKMWPWRDADHSTSSSAEVKNKDLYYASPPWRLHGVAGQFYFLLS